MGHIFQEGYLDEIFTCDGIDKNFSICDKLTIGS